MIDRWFPIAAVDEACGTPAGSGLTEKAIFTWFASRPIAQARAAALTSLLPDTREYRTLVDDSVRTGGLERMGGVRSTVADLHDGHAPTVLDIFSGRGMIPLEAARVGANAIGVDLSPVATLAGCLLAEFPMKDWSTEAELPYLSEASSKEIDFLGDQTFRLVHDVQGILGEVDRRVATRLNSFFPKNRFDKYPWGYLWVTALPCDQCKRLFPLFGALGLRLPNRRANDPGQSLNLVVSGNTWRVDIVDGPPQQQPTYTSGIKADGKNKKGKSARCLFCNHGHDLNAVKAKCIEHQQRDVLVAVADEDDAGNRTFRLPTRAEQDAAAAAADFVKPAGSPYSASPNEPITPGNVHTIQASGYGYETFGDLMVPRQTRQFVESVLVMRELFHEMQQVGISREYAGILTLYAASNLCRRLRRATRGASLALMRGGVSDIFTNESKIAFSFDCFETGLGTGAGTWASVSKSTVRALRKVVSERYARPARFLRASATALPMRDKSVDVVITDPPYYDMIEYADASDIFFVWLKRMLWDIRPDLFGPDAQSWDGLQEKNDEIIVRRVHEPNRVRHDTAFYEDMLAKSFAETRRVLKPQGHLVVIFGHSDPDAWRRLLGALQTAGFVVTSAWPSRTEAANTGVASIKVTVTIGCRVAPAGRPIGIGSEVDRAVVEAVTERVAQWDADGLALEDQLMASYGPAMEVYGRYSRVLNPDGSDASLDHYLGLARRAVRDAMRLRVDELPIETFDAVTRFAIFWLRAKGRNDVPKGEARFFAQADELKLDDLRGRVLVESKAGFKIELQDEKPVTSVSSVFEVARAMAHAWDTGGMEAVADVLLAGGVDPTNHHLWAVVGELASRLPASDKMAKALAGIKRSSATISTLAASGRSASNRPTLFDTAGVQD